MEISAFITNLPEIEKEEIQHYDLSINRIDRLNQDLVVQAYAKGLDIARLRLLKTDINRAINGFKTARNKMQFSVRPDLQELLAIKLKGIIADLKLALKTVLSRLEYEEIQATSQPFNKVAPVQEFESFLTYNQPQKLMEHLKATYNNSKPRNLVPMIFALKNLKYLSGDFIVSSKKDIHAILQKTFGNIGQLRSLETSWNLYNNPTDHHKMLIITQAKTIRKFLEE